jgi:hypothetical protein
VAAGRLWHASQGAPFCRAAAVLCDAAFEQGSDYYFEVECSAEVEGAAKVCRNTKYVKGKRGASGEAAAAPQADSDIHSTGAAVEGADSWSDGPADSDQAPDTDENAGFYDDDSANGDL